MSLNPLRDSTKPVFRELLFLLLLALLIKLCVFSLAIPFGGTFHPRLPDLEGYQDFRLAYVPLVSNFTAGKVPYRDFHYAYPPLFLYLLTVFSLSSLPSWTMALPLVTFDVASVALVYLIVRKLMSSSKAFIASIVFAIAPINLWYNDFLWLNPPPMTFFVLLAVYAFLSKKYKSSFACLAVATLFKQFAFSLFPIFLMTLLKSTEKRRVILNAVLYVAICFFGSLPYIITVPAHYFFFLGVPGFSIGWSSGKFIYYFGSPTSLAVIFGEDFYDPAKPLLWAALLLSFGFLCWRIYKKGGDDQAFLISILCALLLFHAFLPRGIYKYYYAALTPFYSMFIRSRRGVLAFLGLNVLTLIIPRVLTPWVAILLIALLFTRAVSTRVS